MTYTYLANMSKPDGSMKLEVVSRAEWQRILRENALSPKAEKRYFIYDWIMDMVARQAEKDAEEYLSSPTSATLQQILGYRPGQFLGR